MRRLAASTVALWLLVVAGPAGATVLGVVAVGDLAGSSGQWQSGEVTVAVPASEVWRWFTEVSSWPARFPDDAWARDLGLTPDGRRLAELHTNTLGRTLRLELREQPGLITFVGSTKHVIVRGKIYIQAVGPKTTRIIMQGTSELHGFFGPFVGEKLKRRGAIKRLTSDLDAVVRLANAYAVAQRGG